MRFSKKAVSPLIAAVLLIVVVVGVGAVVTGIVRNYVSENKQTMSERSSDLKCGTEVEIEVPSIPTTLRVCKDTVGSYVYALIENTGSATIDDVQFKIFGTASFTNNDTVLTDTNSTAWASGLTKGQSVALNVSYSSLGTLQQIKIVPRVRVVGRTAMAFCTDSALTFNDINDCTIVLS